jgi:hypothetical protein
MSKLVLGHEEWGVNTILGRLHLDESFSAGLFERQDVVALVVTANP